MLSEIGGSNDRIETDIDALQVEVRRRLDARVVLLVEVYSLSNPSVGEGEINSASVLEDILEDRCERAV